MALRGKAADITWQRFGRWRVLGRAAPDSRGRTRWICQCDCGRTARVERSNLVAGKSRSCGCLAIELAKQQRGHVTHGLSRAPEYRTWHAMIQRCRNPNRPEYHNYGGRGIEVCEEWKDFAVFYRDMGPKPSKAHSLDRIDNSGNYAPDNCRWATWHEQNNNTRANRTYDWCGRQMTAPQIYQATQPYVGFTTFQTRLRRGWSIDRAIQRARQC
jgi:hypothetical protein